ncbi:MAG TPA: TetR/AcrR family transcriptional regulator [Acidimicrobiales bacterium]|jgi:AcrR family transcriptional regulator|nr:TetR/AcrR family transcriptional regulator [Acidimicrobiales bacterium]
MATKAEQSEATRAALVGAAEGLFAERGFADTPTEAVVKAAGVTRGALYHHFTDKADLFRAVYESLEQHMIAQVEEAVAGLTDPLEVLHRGTEAFLDACLEPAVQRIVLLEGPSVLGWETWRQIDMAYGLGMVTAVLEVAVQTGAIRAAPVEALAHILLGGLNEGAMLMAASPDPGAARQRMGEALRVVIDGLAARR